MGSSSDFDRVEGFDEGWVLQGSGATRVLSLLRMRSAADLRRLEQDTENRARFEALRKIASPNRDLYDVAWVFTPPTDHGHSVSRGAY